MAVCCQMRPRDPANWPTWKQSSCTRSPGPAASMWRTDSATRGDGSGGARNIPRSALGAWRAIEPGAAEDVPDAMRAAAVPALTAGARRPGPSGAWACASGSKSRDARP